MSERRKKHVQAIFDILDKDHTGSLNLEEVGWHIPDKYLYDQQLVNGDRETMLQYLFNLFDKDGSGLIHFNEWYSFYDDMSAQITSDDVFCAALTQTWGISEDDHTEIPEAYVRGLVERLREKLINRSVGVKEEFILKKIYQDFDIESKHAKLRCFDIEQMDEM